MSCDYDVEQDLGDIHPRVISREGFSGLKSNFPSAESSHAAWRISSSCSRLLCMSPLFVARMVRICTFAQRTHPRVGVVFSPIPL